MPEFDAQRLAEWSGGYWRGMMPSRVTGVTHDTRSLQTGDLYVSLRGENHDGHSFLAAAAQQGASAALVDEQHAAVHPVVLPELVVPDTGVALTDLARGHRARCGGVFMGITGSMGKTTVKELTADVLSCLGTVQKTRLNWNNHIGLPLSLLGMDPAARFGVFEVGMNHPGELMPLCKLLNPSWGILTPIGPVHLEFFDSVEGIAEEKAALIDVLPEAGAVLLSLDDPWYPQLLSHAHSRVIRLSLESPEADYHGVWRKGEKDSLVVTERSTGIQRTYTLPLPGRYMADNALRAIAVGREWGASPDAVVDAVAAYRPPPLRWHEIDVGGIHFVNDAYNAHPVSMRAAIEVFQERAVESGKWLVIGGMREIGETEQSAHEALGHYVAQFPWAGVLTVGPRGRWIADGARARGWDFAIQLTPCADAREAAALLKAGAVPGDRVLLKASRGERVEDVIEIFKEL